MLGGSDTRAGLLLVRPGFVGNWGELDSEESSLVDDLKHSQVVYHHSNLCIFLYIVTNKLNSNMNLK